MPASDRALGWSPALIMPPTFRVSMPRVWYFWDQGAADVVVGVVSESLGPAVGAVDVVLGFPPTPAAGGPACLGALSAFQGPEHSLVTPGVWIMPLAAFGLFRLVVGYSKWVTTVTGPA